MVTIRTRTTTATITKNSPFLSVNESETEQSVLLRFCFTSFSLSRLDFEASRDYSFLSIAPFASRFIRFTATIRALLGYRFLKATAAENIRVALVRKRRLSK
jgi:hypothetical protein